MTSIGVQRWDPSNGRRDGALHVVGEGETGETVRAREVGRGVSETLDCVRLKMPFTVHSAPETL